VVGLHVGLFAIVCSISLFTYAIISKRSHFDWATTRMVTYGHWVTGLDRPTAVLTRVEVAPTALATSPSALVIFRRSVISFARGRQECTHYHADCVSQWCCICSWHTKLTWIGQRLGSVLRAVATGNVRSLTVEKRVRTTQYIPTSLSFLAISDDDAGNAADCRRSLPGGVGPIPVMNIDVQERRA